jgi:tetratricopeptide (TPR) repeat protein
MLEESVTYFDRVLEIESNNTLAMYFKALALDKLGKYSEAITVRDNLLVIDPNDIETLDGKALDLSHCLF